MANDRFGGSSFVGLDKEAIGDGTGDNTAVEDTWLENTVDNAAKYLWRRDGVAWAFPTLGGETRSYRRLASANWAIFARAKLTVSNSLEEIEICLNGSVGIKTTAVENVDFRVRVFSPDLRKIWYESFVRSASSMPQLLTATSQSDQPREENWAWLAVELKSEPDLNSSNVVVKPENLSRVPGTFEPEPFFYQDTNSIASEVREDQMMTGVQTDSNGNITSVVDNERFEQIFARENTNGSDFDRFFHYPQSDESHAEPIGDLDGDPAVFWLSHYRPEAISIRKKYDQDQTDRFWTPKTAESMKPNDPVDGDKVSELPDNLDAVHARAKSHIWGLDEGLPDNPELSDPVGSFSSLPTHWGVIDGPTTYENFAKQSLRIDKDLTNLDVHLSFCPVMKGQECFGTTLADAYDNRTFARWDIRVRLRQLDAGDTSWSDANVVASTTDKIERDPNNQFPHWPISPEVYVTAFRQIAAMMESVTDIGRSYRNGMLYRDVGAGQPDSAVFFSKTIRLDLSSIDGSASERDHGLRLDIDTRVRGTTGSGTTLSDPLLVIQDLHVEEESDVAGEVV